MKLMYPLALGLALVPIPTLTLPPLVSPLEATQVARRTRRPLIWRVGVRPSLYRVGGISRSASCANQAKITAFTPPPRSQETHDKNHAAIDTTLSSHPTLWVHLASLPKNAQAQFTLQTVSGSEELLNKRFPLTAQTGILGVRLPETSPGLKVGETYFWQMKVQCGSKESEDDPIIGSGVQRIQLSQVKLMPGFDPKPLVQKLSRASASDKPALYTELGIWQDAVTALIDLQQKQPNNQELKEDWRSFLQELQMDNLANSPILGVQ
ncbi:DUF928 domain-containing protein [Leptolyngbyaceae cyanobacterium UHCC 1019]